MKITKLSILIAAGLASSGALAGTAMYAAGPAPAPMMMGDTGVYIEGMVGYNRYNFQDGYGDVNPGVGASVGTDWNNGSGNWAFAAAIGYQFARNFSAEAGGIYTQKAKATFSNGLLPPTNLTLKFKPWYAYIAGKLSVPIYDSLSAFAKLGAGYQKVKVDSGTTVTTNPNNWGPMFGAGLSYYFTPAFYLTGQWLRFTGKINNGVVQTTAPNIFLLGLGYKFAM